LGLHDGSAAILSIVICVGRFYRGYWKALRWLANSRSPNTVSFAFNDQHAKDSELWLCCTRITAPDDCAGLRATFEDVQTELAAVDAGLRMWFPHALRGQKLMELEQEAQNDEVLRSMLSSGKTLSDHLRRNEEELSSDFIEKAYGWLGQWEEQLRHIDWNTSQTTSDVDRKDLLFRRARPLLELRRYDELITVCNELDSLADESEKPVITGVFGQALYEKGEFEEVLDVLRSATLDSAARVWLYRCLAQARLELQDEAIESYAEYDRLVGNDIIALKMLREAMPEGIS